MKQCHQKFYIAASVSLGFLVASCPTQAQIIPDATLPVNSIVTPQGNTNTIEGGTRAGGNLFHSFQEFSVPTNTEAFFNNSLDIQNIFSRVTGGAISNIDGLIRANGTANLFLLNPNGILFGPNARLNIGGSFLATTANSLQFADGTQFSATHPQTSPLLTISVPIGLQYGGNQGEIRVQNSGQDLGLLGAFEPFDPALNPLEVNPGNTLALLGGNVVLDGGILQAPGGRIELGGLVGAGIIGLNFAAETGNFTSLQFPEGVERSDVAIANRSGINVLAGGGGSINIHARNIGISGESLLSSGIVFDLGEVNTRAGDITLNATEATSIQQSRIENNVNFRTTGDSGNITIQAGVFSLTDNAVINTTNFEKPGLAGDITITTQNSVLIADQSNISSNGFYGRILIESANGSINISNSSLNTENFDGNLDSINFSVIRLSAPAGSIIIDQSQISTSNFESGFAGDIIINSHDSVAITNESNLSSDGSLGRIFISSSNNSVNISSSSLTTESFDDNEGSSDFSQIKIVAPVGSVMIDQSQISSSNFGSGYAGDIIINARDGVDISQGTLGSNGLIGRILIGQSEDSGETSSPSVVRLDSSILSTRNGGSNTAEDVAIDAGNISINAINDIFLFNTEIAAFSQRLGNSGNVTLASKGDILIEDSSLKSDIAEEVVGEVNAGNILVQATGLVTVFNSQITSEVLSPNVTGTGGNIEINGGSIYMSQRNQSRLGTRTSGAANAGNILLNSAENIWIERTDIASDTFGEGNAGNIRLQANGLVDVLQTFITSEARRGATGTSGAIALDGESVFLTENSALRTSTFDGERNAGNITINARDTVGIVASSITSNAEEVALGGAGNIAIAADFIEVTDGALIESTNYVSGNAGNVALNARDSLLIWNSNIYSDAFNSQTNIGGGFSGIISLTAGNSFEVFSSVISADSYGGEAAEPTNNSGLGFISVNAGSVSLSNTSLSAITSGSGTGGYIEILAQSVSITDASKVQASSSGTGNAGNITLDGSDTVSIENSSILSNANGAELAGNLTIRGGSVSISDRSFIQSSNFASGDAGNISIEARENISVVNSSIFSDTFNSDRPDQAGGYAGIIWLTAGNSLQLVNSHIAAESFGGTDAAPNSGYGIISVSADTVSLSEQAILSTSTFGSGQGGDVTIEARSLSVTGGSRVESRTEGKANAGNILVNASESVTLSGVSPLVFDQDGFFSGGNSSGLYANTDAPESGVGGNIEVNTGRLRISDGAVISARTRSVNSGGNIAVNIDHLELTGGGQILATAFSRGAAGSITVDARNHITITGFDPTYRDRVNQVVEAFKAQGLSEQDAQLQTQLAIAPDSPASGLSVNGRGTGAGGNINVTSRSIRLENGLENEAAISAVTASGDGGNITLRSRDLLLLRRTSNISTSAGTVGAGGNGGNINLRTNNLVAIENSDITANAFEGNGGNIQINAQGIFGTQFRDAPTPQSDITASSRFGLAGNVAILTPNVDPSQGLVDLPEEVVDPSNQIAQGCAAGRNNQFSITGRGGLPPAPTDSLNSNAVWVDLGTVQARQAAQTGGGQGRTTSRSQPSPANTQIVEASGWTVNAKGEVVLTAAASTATPHRPGFAPVECQP